MNIEGVLFQEVMQAMVIRQIFLVCSVNVLGNFSEWPHSNRHKDCPHMSCYGDFSKVYIKLFSFSLYGFGKGTVLVS